MHFSTFVFSLLFVFLGTRNGRALLLRSIVNGLHYVPIKIRRAVTAQSYKIPLSLTRLSFNILTMPLDQQNCIQSVNKGAWKGNWISPKLTSLKQVEEMAVKQDLIILYMHGGGYSMGTSTMFMSTYKLILATLFKHKINTSILSLEYSLSPEHNYPQQRNEALACYRYLVNDLGIPASKIVLMGDSAGGNLVATTLLQKDIPLPAAAALISPWIDLSCQYEDSSNDSLCSSQIQQYIHYYIGTGNSLATDPYVSTIYGDYSHLSNVPVFLAYGQHEMLGNSIKSFKHRLESSGCNVTTIEGKDQSHIWLMYSLLSTSIDIYHKDLNSLVNWLITIIG